MSGCKGLHCSGCGGSSSGGGGAGLGIGGAIAVVVLVVALGSTPPVQHAIGTGLRVAVDVLEITGIIIASLAASAAAAGLAVAGVRIRRAIVARQRRRAAAITEGAPRVIVIPPVEARVLPVSQGGNRRYQDNHLGTVPTGRAAARAPRWQR